MINDITPYIGVEQNADCPITHSASYLPHIESRKGKAGIFLETEGTIKDVDELPLYLK
jgi:hypothetical protein